jgi:hypothetical protein
MKYEHKIQMPTVTIYTSKKVSKRKLIGEALYILFTELENNSLYKESQKEFKVKTTTEKK